METVLAKKLKNFLDNQTKEDVLESWEAIRELNMQGPTLNDAIEHIDSIQIEEPEMNFDFSESSFNTYQSFGNKYNLAA